MNRETIHSCASVSLSSDTFEKTSIGSQSISSPIEKIVPSKLKSDKDCSSQEEFQEITAKEGLTLYEEVKTGCLSFSRLCSLCGSDADVFSADTYLRTRVYEMNSQIQRQEKKTSDHFTHESNLLRINHYKKSENKRSVQVQYEAFAQTLNKEFIDHVKANRRWCDRELLNTMRSALSGLRELHEAGLTHGDVRMSAIVLSECNKVKIADQFAINFTTVSVAPSYLRKDTKLLVATCALLPPEALELLYKNKKNQQPYSFTTSAEADLWALGVILLELMLLESVHMQLYDFENHQIRLLLLDKKKVKAKCLYHNRSHLHNLLDILLAIDAKTRLRAYSFIDRPNKSSVQITKGGSINKDDQPSGSYTHSQSDCNSHITCNNNSRSCVQIPGQLAGQNEEIIESSQPSDRFHISLLAEGKKTINGTELKRRRKDKIEQDQRLDDESVVSRIDQQKRDDLSLSQACNRLKDDSENEIQTFTDSSRNSNSVHLVRGNTNDTNRRGEDGQCIPARGAAAVPSSNSVSIIRAQVDKGQENLFFVDDLSSIASTSMPVPHAFVRIGKDNDSKCLERISLNLDLSELKDGIPVRLEVHAVGESNSIGTSSSFEMISIPPLEEESIRLSESSGGGVALEQNTIIHAVPSKEIRDSSSQLSRQQAQSDCVQDENTDASNEVMSMAELQGLNSCVASSHYNSEDNRGSFGSGKQSFIGNEGRRVFTKPVAVLKSPALQQQQSGVFILGKANVKLSNPCVGDTHTGGEVEEEEEQVNRIQFEKGSLPTQKLNDQETKETVDLNSKKQKEMYEIETKMLRLGNLCDYALERSARVREMMKLKNLKNSFSNQCKNSSSNSSGRVNNSSKSNLSSSCYLQQCDGRVFVEEEKGLLDAMRQQIQPFSDMSETSSRVLSKGEIKLPSDYDEQCRDSLTSCKESMTLLDQMKYLSEELNLSSCQRSQIQAQQSARLNKPRSNCGDFLFKTKYSSEQQQDGMIDLHSKEENLRLSAHYGTLALSHLAEYIAKTAKGAEKQSQSYLSSRNEGEHELSSFGGRTFDSKCQQESSYASNELLVRHRVGNEQDGEEAGDYGAEQTLGENGTFETRKMACILKKQENMSNERLLQNLFDCGEEASTTSNYKTVSSHSNSNSCCVSHGYRTMTTSSYNASCSDSIASLVGAESLARRISTMETPNSSSFRPILDLNSPQNGLGLPLNRNVNSNKTFMLI